MNSSSTSDTQGPASLVRLGGGLGIAGAIIGLLVFIVGCMGSYSGFPFSVLPLIMGSVGLLLSLVGAFQQKKLVMEDTRVLSSFFVNAIAIIGGLLEMAIWLNWSIFYKN